MAARARVLCRPMASWAKNTIQDHYFHQAKVRCVGAACVCARRRRRRAPPPLTRASNLPWQAQKQGYVSRAAYKLLEIQKKHKVIRKGRAAAARGGGGGGGAFVFGFGFGLDIWIWIWIGYLDLETRATPRATPNAPLPAPLARTRTRKHTPK